MGQIRKRGNTWWIRFYVRGRRVEESAHTSVWEDARDLLREKEGAIAKGGGAIVAKRFLFEDAATDIENDYTRTGAARSPS